MLAVEERVVEHGVGAVFGGRGQDGVYGGVAFAVERGEEIQEHGEHCAAEGKARVAAVETGEDALETVHRAREI